MADEAKIIHFMAIDSMLAPVSMMKRIWQRNADHFMQKGALKVVSSTATANAKFSLNYPFKFLSKSIWKLDQFKEFAKDFDVSKLETKWTVYNNDIGSFITAAVDFKDLKPGLGVEFITSKFDKIVIAVRCRNNASEDDSLFLQRSKAGEHLKQIVNDILCFDYDNFLGYILYKRLDINNHITDIENQPFYDWVVEVLLGDKGTSYSLDMLSGKAKALNDNGFDVRYGIFSDTDCFHSKMNSVSSPAQVGT